jgi:cytochrome b subunit of formate dehydrogenase
MFVNFNVMWRTWFGGDAGWCGWRSWVVAPSVVVVLVVLVVLVHVSQRGLYMRNKLRHYVTANNSCQCVISIRDGQ